MGWRGRHVSERLERSILRCDNQRRPFGRVGNGPQEAAVTGEVPVAPICQRALQQAIGEMCWAVLLPRALVHRVALGPPFLQPQVEPEGNRLSFDVGSLVFLPF